MALTEASTPALGLHDGKQQVPGNTFAGGSAHMHEEMQLRIIYSYLEEVWSLHECVKARLQELEQNIEYKDAQLADHARVTEEARARCADLQEQAERLEEDNAELRDALMEGHEQNKYLRHLLEVRTKEKMRAQEALWAYQQQAQQRQPMTCRSPAEQEYVDSLNQKLKETKDRMILLEEQLRMQSTVDKDAPLEEMTCTQNQMSVSPADAWAAVGHGAADRICGGTPHTGGSDDSKAVAEASIDAPQQEAPASTRGPDTDQSEVSTTPAGTARTQVSMVITGDDEVGDAMHVVPYHAQPTIPPEVANNIDNFERRHSEGSTPMSTIEEYIHAHGIPHVVNPLSGLPPNAVVAPVPSRPSAPLVPVSVRNFPSGPSNGPTGVRLVRQPVGQVPRNTPSRQRGPAVQTLPRGQT